MNATNCRQTLLKSIIPYHTCQIHPRFMAVDHPVSYNAYTCFKHAAMLLLRGCPQHSICLRTPTSVMSLSFGGLSRGSTFSCNQPTAHPCTRRIMIGFRWSFWNDAILEWQSGHSLKSCGYKLSSALLEWQGAAPLLWGKRPACIQQCRVLVSQPNDLICLKANF